MKTCLVAFSLLLGCIFQPLCAQDTAFTYQGRLNDGAYPAYGSYDLTFALFRLSSGAGQVGLTQTNPAVAVSNGLFTVVLDFGANFTGADRWLEIGVRTNGGGAFTLLTPRQPITSTPYAIRSANAASATSVSGSVSAAQLTGAISSNNIAAGSITANMLAAGAVGANQLAAGAVTTAALADGAVTSGKVATGSNWIALTIPNPHPVDGFNVQFGVSLAVLGNNSLIVGSYYGDGGDGAAYVYNTNGGLTRTFFNPSQTTGPFADAIAVVGTDYVLIGASSEDPFGITAAGVAYLMRTNGGLQTTFTNPAPTDLAFFGSAVAALGTDRVLIGARENDIGASGAGAAYLFNTNGTLLNTFTNPAPGTFDRFGSAVAAGFDRVLIGAPQDDTAAGPNSGAAYLFTTNGALLTTFTNAAASTNAALGSAVAWLGNDRVLIGAPDNNSNGLSPGAAYLFRTNGTLLATFSNPASDPASSDFGKSVTPVGTDRVLIGAPGNNPNGSKSGAAYLFSTNGTLLATFLSPDPDPRFTEFGHAVAALGNDRLLISARGSFNAKAAVYLFNMETFNPGLVADEVKPRSIVTSSLEDEAVTAAKIGGELYPSQIPDLNANKITSGVFTTNRIPNLNAAKITSGTLDDDRLSTNVTRLIGAQVLANNGLASAPGLAFQAEPNTGLFHPVPGALGVVAFGGERMRVTSLGRVGIGITNPATAFHVRETGDAEISIESRDTGAHRWTLQSGEVSGNANLDASFQVIDRTAGSSRFFIGTNGNVGIGSSSPGFRLEVNGSAGKPGGGSWSSTSDARLKKNIRPLADALDKLLALHGVNFEYVDPEKIHELSGERMGLIAQEVEKVFPDWVETGPNGFKCVTVRGLEALVVEALRELRQEQQAQAAALKAEKDSEIASLKQRLAKLEQLLLAPEQEP